MAFNSRTSLSRESKVLLLMARPAYLGLGTIGTELSGREFDVYPSL